VGIILDVEKGQGKLYSRGAEPYFFDCKGHCISQAFLWLALLKMALHHYKKQTAAN
jgi:hypothetical protein